MLPSGPETSLTFIPPAGKWPLLSSSDAPSTSAATLCTVFSSCSSNSCGAAGWVAAGWVAGVTCCTSCRAASDDGGAAATGAEGGSGVVASASTKAQRPRTVLTPTNLLRLMRAATAWGSTPVVAKEGARSAPSSSRRPTPSIASLRAEQGFSLSLPDAWMHVTCSTTAKDGTSLDCSSLAPE